MKNIYKLLLIVSVVLLSSSCIKETFPKGSTVTKDQLEQSDEVLTFMLRGIPAAMGTTGAAGFFSTYGYHYDFGISAVHYALESMLEDLAILGELGYFWWNGWYQNLGQGPEYTSCAYFWQQYYMWIKLANDILNVAGEITEDTDKQVKEIVGQAHAYRAMYYLDLARMYEPKPNETLMPSADIIGLTVPIVTENTTEEIAKRNPRAKREEMYQFILSDLEKAEKYLNKDLITYSSPTLLAVYGLYARAYLELGATYKEMGDPADWEMTSTEAYTQAAKYARKVINSKNHSPLTQAQWEDPVNGFNNGAANSAWIWGLTTTSENQNNLVSNIAHRSCEALYGYAPLALPGVNQALFSRISDDDFRKHSWYDPESGYSYKLAGNGTIQGNYFVYHGYGLDAVKHMSLKFRPADGEVLNYTIGNVADWCLMRIEEMYFIEMEAELGKNNLEKARELLNDFMQKYRYDSYDCTTLTMTAEAFINEMMLQKRIEFWGEGILYFDYKRLNMGITRGYTGTNIPATATFNCKGRSPQWNIVITRGEYQSNKILESQNNPDPTKKLTLWQ